MTTETLLPEANEHADNAGSMPVAGQAAKEGDDISLLDILPVVAERKRIVVWVTAALAFWPASSATPMTAYSASKPD